MLYLSCLGVAECYPDADNTRSRDVATPTNSRVLVVSVVFVLCIN